MIVVRASGAAVGSKELLSFSLDGDDDKVFILVCLVPSPSGMEDWFVWVLRPKKPTGRQSTLSYEVMVSMLAFARVLSPARHCQPHRPSRRRSCTLGQDNGLLP